ncbi:MAG: hypothetical protein HY769_09085, partial [Candidatus Stahlbacteria bacterium]|nr:hypothetical protein [Candidatus Stahlbacteria bacterium]
DGDREGLGLKVRDTEPTSRAAITVAPCVMLKSGAGATIQVRCRGAEDSTKASRHENADAIELRYKIGDAAPVSPANCTDTVIFTRAIHTLKLDIADAGKRFYGFLRWKNTTDDAKSGPWSTRHQATIAE